MSGSTVENDSRRRYEYLTLEYSVKEAFSDLDEVNIWYLNVANELKSKTSVLSAIEYLKLILDSEYPRMSVSEVLNLKWDDSRYHICMRARGHLLGMIVDALSDASQDHFLNNVENSICLRSFRSRLNSGPGVFARMIIKGMGQILDNGTIHDLTRDLGYNYIAVSHVWGHGGLLISETEPSEIVISYDGSCCSNGWNVGERFRKKFRYAQKLCTRVWQDTFNIPQCCTNHKRTFIPRISQHYLLAKAALALPDWSPYENVPSDAMSQIIKLGQEGWFDRAWIAQEIALCRVMIIMDGLTYYRDISWSLLNWQLNAAATSFQDLSRIRRYAYSFRNLRSYPVSLNPINDPMILMFNKKCYYPQDRVYALANICRLNIVATYDNNYSKVKNSDKILFSKICRLNSSISTPHFRPLMASTWLKNSNGCSSVPSIGVQDRNIWPEYARHEVLHWGSDLSITVRGLVRHLRIPVRWTAIELEIIRREISFQWQLSLNASISTDKIEVCLQGNDWRDIILNFKNKLRLLQVAEDEIISVNLLRWVLEAWITPITIIEEKMCSEKLLIRLSPGQWLAISCNEKIEEIFKRIEMYPDQMYLNPNLTRNKINEMILCKEQDDCQETVEAAIVVISDDGIHAYHCGHVWYCMNLTEAQRVTVNKELVLLPTGKNNCLIRCGDMFDI